MFTLKYIISFLVQLFDNLIYKDHHSSVCTRLKNEPYSVSVSFIMSQIIIILIIILLLHDFVLESAYILSHFDGACDHRL